MALKDMPHNNLQVPRSLLLCWAAACIMLLDAAMHFA